MSNRAWAVDLVHSIGEKTALVDHLEEKLLASDDEEEKEQLKEMIFRVTDLRRSQMSFLLEQAEKPNPLYHCAFKHSLKAFTLDCEVFEADRSDASLSHLEASGEVLAMVMSKYLGMEFETCSRCLHELLLVKEYDKNNNKEK